MLQGQRSSSATRAEALGRVAQSLPSVLAALHDEHAAVRHAALVWLRAAAALGKEDGGKIKWGKELLLGVVAPADLLSFLAALVSCRSVAGWRGAGGGCVVGGRAGRAVMWLRDGACVRRVSACVKRVSAYISRVSACVRRVSACVSRVPACVSRVSACVSRVSACVSRVSACVSRVSAILLICGAPTRVLSLALSRSRALSPPPPAPRFSPL